MLDVAADNVDEGFARETGLLGFRWILTAVGTNLVDSARMLRICGLALIVEESLDPMGEIAR